jgi:hypothetical protein
MNMQIEVRPTLIVNTKAYGRASVDLIWLSQLLKDIGQGSLHGGCQQKIRHFL